MSVLKKACLCSSCSIVGTKKFKRIPVEEFLFSKITALEHATLLDSELLHRHSPTLFNCNCRMIYYKGIVGDYAIVLKFYILLEKTGKNTLKGEYQKEGIKYEGERDTSRIPTANFICL